MQLSTVTRVLIGASTLTAALAWGAPAQARAPQYEILLLPPFVVDGVEQRGVVYSDLNNLGQVTGGSWYSPFRYTPSVGMEAIELEDGAPGAGRWLNDRGDVVGQNYDTLRWFLYSEDAGLDPLDRGLSGRRLDDLVIFDLNNHGDLVGGTFTGKRFIPVLYTAEDGWIKLANIDPRFKKAAVAKWINDAGDLVFTISRPPGQQSFVLREGRTLVELDDFGGGVNVPGDLNERGELAGLFVDRSGREQAYLFRPGLGTEQVVPGKFREVMAGWITEEGVVGGMAKKKYGLDTLFSVDRTGRRQVLKHRKFRRLARAAGSRMLTSISIETMNERVEFIGEVKAGKPRLWIPFYYSRAKGLHTIQSIVDAAGSDLEVESVIDLNDRGQILVEARRSDGTSTGAILTPLE